MINRMAVSARGGDGERMERPLVCDRAERSALRCSLASVLAVVAALANACSSSTAPTTTADPVLVGIFLAPRDTSIPQKHSVQLRLTAVDSAGNEVKNVSVRPAYSTNNSALVSVSPQGLVQSLGPTGHATITAQLGDFSDTVGIFVLDSSLAARVPLTSRAYAVAISSAGVAYVGQPDLGNLIRADLPNMAFTASVAVGNIPTEVAFNSTGTKAYVTNQFSQNVGVIDVASNTQTATVPVAGNPFAVIVAPGDSIVWVTTTADSLFGINASTLQITRRQQLPIISNGFAIRDSLLYVSTRDAGIVTEINMKTTTVLRTFPVGGAPQGIVVSPDGTQLYIANENATLQFWSLINNSSLGTTPLAGRGFGLARRPTDGNLYVTTLEAGLIEVIDPATQAVVRSIQVGGIPRRIAFTPNGRTGVVPNEASWVDFLR
jgi:YVTN family beta-propeller protein